MNVMNSILGIFGHERQFLPMDFIFVLLVLIVVVLTLLLEDIKTVNDASQLDDFLTHLFVRIGCVLLLVAIRHDDGNGTWNIIYILLVYLVIEISIEYTAVL